MAIALDLTTITSSKNGEKARQDRERPHPPPPPVMGGDESHQIQSQLPDPPETGRDHQDSRRDHWFPLCYACEDSWSWNPKDRSHEVRLYGPKNRIAHFHPNWSNGTAGVRGTRVLNNGRFYWEINVSQRIFGTSMMFGIGTKSARLHVDAFVNMIGEDSNSWGLSHKGFIWHGGKFKSYTNPFRENVGTTIGLYFDGLNGTLTFYKDGVNLGVAFTGLSEVSEPLYPIVCSTAAKTEMALGVMRRDYSTLQDRCRAVILRHLSSEKQISDLGLPKILKEFLHEGTDDFQADLQLVRNNKNNNASSNFRDEHAEELPYNTQFL